MNHTHNRDRLYERDSRFDRQIAVTWIAIYVLLIGFWSLIGWAIVKGLRMVAG